MHRASKGARRRLQAQLDQSQRRLEEAMAANRQLETSQLDQELEVAWTHLTSQSLFPSPPATLPLHLPPSLSPSPPPPPKPDHFFGTD